MRKSVILLFALTLASFLIAASAFAVGSHMKIISATGWIRLPNAGGRVIKCTAHARGGQYLAKITSSTDNLGWLEAITNATDTIDMSTWVDNNGTTGGYAPGTAGVYLTEVTAASNAFAECVYTDPT